jgi:hypothetical protein
VLGQELTLEECPDELKGFMQGLGAIGKMAKEVEEEDTKAAMKLAERGRDVPVPRMERVVEMLEKGIGYQDDSRTGLTAAEEDRRRSVEGRAVAFANRINALALGVSRLKPFRERQREVFKVLAGL